MYAPREITPDPRTPRTPLDRLGDTQPVTAKLALFECTRAGRLLDCNAAYRDLESSSGLGEDELATRLIAAIGPGRETVTASFAFDTLGTTRKFDVRFVPVSTVGENDVKYIGMMRDATLSPIKPDVDTFMGWPAEELPRVNSDWYWETSAAGQLTSVSSSLELLVGARPGGLLGLPLSRVGKLIAGEGGEMPIDQAHERGSSFRDQLMSIDTVSGGTRLYRLAGVAVWDSMAGGNGYRGVAVVMPNSARLIERMRSELGRSAKQQFLSAMSHELRTPLNAIIGFAEAMSHQVHGPLKPQYVDYAGDIAGAGRHLLGLIQDLLDISSLDSGEIELDCDSFDLAALIDQARAMVSVNAAARQIDLRSAELPNPVHVRADRRRTLQIFVNLLGNAVKFTPECGLVGCSLAEAESPYEVAVTVFDTGPGIDPRDHARVFEKFEQLADQPHVARGEGAGLGLHISRRLAGLMGGSLTLDSRLGEGARFTLTLPAA